MTRTLFLEGRAARSAQTCTMRILIISADKRKSVFRLLVRQPMAPSLPLWGTETSVRRRFLGSSRTSRYSPLFT
jgi:hypothetical protein